jgi:hypothetical protein
MTGEDLQNWLNAHGQVVGVDGSIGPQSRAAIMAAFANVCAEAVTDADIAALATRIGCTTKQLRAVAKVESGGKAFDDQGRPKILFERHKFHQLTNGQYSVTSYSNPTGGGYNEGSWLKLTMAAGKDVDAAFSAASWGKFQVLGLHWRRLGYPSPLEMAYSTVISEASHYEMLARYIEQFGLRQAISQISTTPADNELFARLYNGPRYKQFAYDQKLAKAMA